MSDDLQTPVAPVEETKVEETSTEPTEETQPETAPVAEEATTPEEVA